MRSPFALGILALALAFNSAAEDEHHSHPAPEKLGMVSFPTTCAPAVAPQFNRAVALLHSFAYTDAEHAFRDVLGHDPQCAMAHWGVAMSLYHQLWEPPSGADLSEGSQQIHMALQQGGTSVRERRFIEALDV